METIFKVTEMDGSMEKEGRTKDSWGSMWDRQEEKWGERSEKEHQPCARTGDGEQQGFKPS